MRRTRATAVHYDTGNRAKCGRPGALHFTGTREHVTCRNCLNILNGVNTGGIQPLDRQPHGTLAAARRHYRLGDRNLRDTCPPCWRAEHRDRADRYARAA